MLNRREFLWSGAAVLTACSQQRLDELPSVERVDRVLAGEAVDRPPFTFYYHFGLENLPGEHHARATLEFQKKFHTDIVKVMSDFAFPTSEGEWYEVIPVENPYPEQLRALEMIRDGLEGNKYFIETVFNPWNVAEKMSSPEEVLRLKEEEPQLLLDALEGIATSQVQHVKKALEFGAAGIFLAIANAQDGLLSEADYGRFSEPFDKMVMEAVADAPLNTLHLHGEGAYLERFFSGWPAAVIQYSTHGTGVPIEEVRARYDGVLMGGIDERSFRDLTRIELKQQWQAAQSAAGKKFILAPGCSVPDETSDEELLRLVELMLA